MQRGVKKAPAWSRDAQNLVYSLITQSFLSHSLDTTWHAKWERGQFDAWVDLSGNVHERIDHGHNWRRSLSSLWDTLLTIHDGIHHEASNFWFKMNQHLDQKLDASRCILRNILSFSLLNPWRYLTSSAASRKITNRFKSRYALETWVTCLCTCLFCLVINCSLQCLKSHYSYRVEVNYKVK